MSVLYFEMVRFKFHLFVSDKFHHSDLLAGVAPTPYQYRALVPWLVNWMSTSPWGEMVHFPVFFRAVDTAFLFLAIIALRSLLTEVTHNGMVAALGSLLFPVLLPFNTILFPMPWYPWDMPAIFFTALGMLFLMRGQFVPYYLVFAVATLNRETTFLLTLIHLLTHAGRSRPSVLVRHLAAQAAIWVGIKWWLYGLYAHNPGGGNFEMHFMENLGWLADTGIWLLLVSSFGFLSFPVAVLYPWINHPFIKRAIWSALPYTGLMLCVGLVYEVRIYGELFPVMIAAFVSGLAGYLEKAGGTPRSGVAEV